MKKLCIVGTAFFVTHLYGGFDFGECSGSGTFQQEIHKYTSLEDAITVGEIPQGIKGLNIQLISDNDVDIRLYGENNDKIVHWPYGILKGSAEETGIYKVTSVTYSGVGGQLGHEFIRIDDATPRALTMKAFGYKSGHATVNYSWTGKEGCVALKSGSGHFTQDVQQNSTTLVGNIPANINNVEIYLTSENDIDIQLYGEDGTAIVSWKPKGLLSGSSEASLVYHDMNITWSGYSGTHGHPGNEYIKITGNTSEPLVMKVFGYQSGTANVDYSWGEKNTTDIKTPPAGLVMRGKTKYSYCDLARGNLDGGYCQIAWADLEPTEGNYDFHLIDDALVAAQAYNTAHNLDSTNGFKVLIRLRTGIYSPDWVKNKVGSIEWYFRRLDDKHQLPIFWETPFQNEYKKVMQTLSDRYDNNDDIGLVAASMCMTKHTEIMWNRTGRREVNADNMENLLSARDVHGNSVPYSNRKDYMCLEKQIDIHTEVWKRTPTIFGSHLYQMYDEDDGSHTPHYNKTIKLFNYCTDTLGKRCIVGNNSLLHTENNTDYNINRAITEMSDKGFNTYYQTHVFKDNSNKSFDFDDLQVAIDHAI